MNKAMTLIFASILLCGPSLEAFNTVNNTDQEIEVSGNVGSYYEHVKPHTTSHGWYYTGPEKQINLQVRWLKCGENPYEGHHCNAFGPTSSCNVSPHGQQTVTGTSSGAPVVRCD